jgi:hypothetical protein
MQHGPGQPWDGATGAIAVQTHHAHGSAPGAPLSSEDRRRTGRPGSGRPAPRIGSYPLTSRPMMTPASAAAPAIAIV